MSKWLVGWFVFYLVLQIAGTGCCIAIYSTVSSCYRLLFYACQSVFVCRS